MSTLNIRTDPEVDLAIDYLVNRTGVSKSAAVRQALIQAARQARLAEMRAVSYELSQDPDDLAEAQAVLDYMGGGDAW